jgi:expansin (peptidoglycan-binding protein)
MIGVQCFGIAVFLVLSCSWGPFVVAMQNQAGVYQGSVSYFNNTATIGSCGFQNVPLETAALPVSMMGAAPSNLCGLCVQINTTNATTFAVITDTNQSTGADIVVSAATFQKLADPRSGRIACQWTVVQCPPNMNQQRAM